MRVVFLALLLAGCGHLSLDNAVTAHNVFRQVLVDASDSYKTIYGAAAASFMNEKQDADYYAAMKPYDEVVVALRSCQQAEQVLHGILEQCVASGDGTCDLARTGFACAASALDSLSSSYGQVRGGAPLYAATAIAKAQLLELANGATCEVTHGSP